MINLAIFASGNGSNAENLIKYFAKSDLVFIPLIFTNNPKAKVIQRVHKLKKSCLVFTREDLYENNFVLKALKDNNIDFIVLAGFLWLIPMDILQAYPRRIVNIHPALLPNFGGKGMYGQRVHKAVLESGVKQSGITIHYVNELYDRGDIIFQKICPVFPNDTIQTLSERIHKLEYKYYPIVIEQIIKSLDKTHKI